MPRPYKEVRPLTIWRFKAPVVAIPGEPRVGSFARLATENFLVAHWFNGRWQVDTSFPQRPNYYQIHPGAGNLSPSSDKHRDYQRWGIIGPYNLLSYPFVPKYQAFSRSYSTSSVFPSTQGTITSQPICPPYVGHGEGKTWFFVGFTAQGDGTYTTQGVPPYETGLASRMPQNSLPTAFVRNKKQTYSSEPVMQVGWIPLRPKSQHPNPYSAHLGNLLPQDTFGLFVNPLGRWE